MPYAIRFSCGAEVAKTKPSHCGQPLSMMPARRSYWKSEVLTRLIPILCSGSRPASAATGSSGTWAPKFLMPKGRRPAGCLQGSPLDPLSACATFPALVSGAGTSADRRGSRGGFRGVYHGGTQPNRSGTPIRRSRTLQTRRLLSEIELPPAGCSGLRITGSANNGSWQVTTP